jgi:alpha/beta superfamily hydrolase
MQPLLSQRSEKIIIPGPAGALEALLALPTNNCSDFVTIICHPHPLYGGSMTNKVVTTIAKSCDELNMATIRFNYRGVGNSDGIYDNAKGEREDLLAIHAWAKNRFPHAAYILAGFSFGSYICCAAAENIKPTALITIAPAIARQSYADVMTYKGQWWLIQGEQDELTDAATVFEWFKKHVSSTRIINIANASHFFHGCLPQLQHEIVNTIGPSILCR